MPNYGNYFPASYQPIQPMTQQYPQNNGIVWVQGEAGAKSYLVGAGNSVILMDSEDSTFYIKSTDASGMPLPLRTFDYTERKAEQHTNLPLQAQNASQSEIDSHMSAIDERIHELDERMTKLDERMSDMMARRNQNKKERDNV